MSSEPMRGPAGPPREQAEVIQGYVLRLRQIFSDSGRRLDEALRELNRAVAIQASLGDHESQAWCLISVSGAQLEAGRLAKALSSAQPAMALSEREGVSLYVRAHAVHATAAAHRSLGNLEPALRLAGSALEMAGKSGARRAEIEAHLEIATIHRLLGEDTGSVAAHAMRACELARGGGFGPLAEAAAALGQAT